jgi:hypothetical protein
MARMYGVNPQHENSELIEMNRTRSLSTRYSPDRVGVQARRVSDGVWQDPYTNRVYDYNDGFKTESGEEFPGGHVALQSHMIGLASHLDSVGLHKEADYLDALIKRAGSREDVLSIQDLDTLYKLYAQKENIPYDPEGPPTEAVAEAFRGLDWQSPLVKELLGLDSGEAIMHDPGPSAPDDYLARMLAGDPTRFEDHPEHTPSRERVDYGRAVASAIQILRSISRSASYLNRRDAYELMEVVFEVLAGEEAVQALSTARSDIDQQSEESGSGRGFLG